MSLEEAIKHAEEVEIEQIRLMCRYDAASGYMRSGDESIRTESAKKCEQCAAEHKQLAAFLRELKERRKADSCEGCVNESKPNLLVCYTCRRHWHYADLYKERRTDADD